MKEKVKLSEGDFALLDVLEDPVLFEEFSDHWLREVVEPAKRHKAEQEAISDRLEKLIGSVPKTDAAIAKNKKRHTEIQKLNEILAYASDDIGMLEKTSEVFLPSSIDSETKAKMNHRVGVYVIIKDSKVLYVGETINLKGRLAEHHWGFGADKVLFVECKDKKSRLAKEKELTQKFIPPFNKQNK